MDTIEMIKVTRAIQILPADLKLPKPLKLEALAGWVSGSIAIRRKFFPGPPVKILSWKRIRPKAKGDPWVSVTYEIAVRDADIGDIKEDFD
jgi:hypothetical protein